LRKQLVTAICGHTIEFLQTFDGFLNRREVRQQSTQPTLVDIEHAAAIGFFGDGILGLPLGADEENDLALSRDIGNELGGFLEEFESLLKIDDVDTVALSENVLLHLRIPALRLVAEMYAGLQELLHCDRRQINLRLTFRELEAFARSRLTIFLALLHSRVAPQKAQLLQNRPQVCVELNQRPGYAVLDRASLTMHTAAFNKNDHVELAERVGSLQGLPHQHAVGLVEEVCLEGLVI